MALCPWVARRLYLLLFSGMLLLDYRVHMVLGSIRTSSPLGLHKMSALPANKSLGDLIEVASSLEDTKNSKGPKTEP